MPIKIDTLEPDLYVLHWIGDIKLAEIRASHKETARMAAAAGVKRYIHVLDLIDLGAFPFDPIAYYRLLTEYPQNFAVMSAGGPFLARSAIRILERMLKKQIMRSLPNLESALSEARQLLAHEQHA